MKNMNIKAKKSMLTLLIATMTVTSFLLLVETTSAAAEGTMTDQDLGAKYIMPGEQKMVQKVIISDGGGDGGSLSIDRFRLDNYQGTVSDEQITNVSLWRDNGDGVFDAETDSLSGFNNTHPLSQGVTIGQDDNFPIHNIANGISYTVFVVVNLSSDADEDGMTIKMRLDGNDLCSSSISSWSGDGVETATSTVTIDTIPTGTLSVDQDVVNEKELEFSVRVTYDQEMNTAVAPTIQFSGNSGVTSLVTAYWDGSHTVWLGTYEITDVDEGSSVTVSSSGAEDLNGNAEGACDETIFRVDTAAPSIDSVTGSTTGTTGETTTISAAFSDNIEVASATMHYMMLGGSWQSKSILSGSADIDIPSDSTTVWYYYVTVNDSADNGNRSPSGIAWYAVLTTDNDAPVFSDMPTTHPTEGEDYNFTIVASDNIEVDTVYLNYYFAGSWNNESMAYNDISGKYFKVLNVPESATILHYNISANDTNNNWNETGDTTLSVDDGGSNGGNQGPGENEPPVADAGGSYQITVNQTMIFDGSTSFDSDGIIVNYTWDFGDNTTGYGVKPTHSYNILGSYSITLTVKDNDGSTDSNMTTITILIDSDGDGYGDSMENSYGTNESDITDYPMDTDSDGIPDDDSPDGNYTGDPDDDDDGLNDEMEEKLGSDPKNATDVKSLEMDGTYIIDIDGDGQHDKFYNATSKINTTIEVNDDGNYLIDIDGDGEYDIIYNPEDGKTTPYEPEEQADKFPWLIAIVGIILAIMIVTIIFILFKTGRIYL